jgi:hypothetical protein
MAPQILDQLAGPGNGPWLGLAHVVGDEAERSYDRGELFEKRRALMNAWAAFATSDPAKTGDNVVELRSVQ